MEIWLVIGDECAQNTLVLIRFIRYPWMTLISLTSTHTIMRAYLLVRGTSKQLVAILLIRGLTSVPSLRLLQMALVTICKSSRRGLYKDVSYES